MNKKLARDIFNWDVYNWSRSIEIWESKLDFNRSHYKCLELGAGPGGISLWLALKGHSVLCTDCYDISDRVAPMHQKYGVTTIKSDTIDALNIPFENEFDIVILKSVLGGIGEDDKVLLAVKQIHKSLKPHGYFVFAENLKSTRLHMALRKRFSDVGKTWNYLEFPFLCKTLSEFSQFDLKKFGMFGVFGRNELQKEIIGKLDKYFFEKIFPEKWSYIVAGVARK